MHITVETRLNTLCLAERADAVRALDMLRVGHTIPDIMKELRHLPGLAQDEIETLLEAAEEAA